jgi:hypothetical protein
LPVSSQGWTAIPTLLLSDLGLVRRASAVLDVLPELINQGDDTLSRFTSGANAVCGL